MTASKCRSEVDTRPNHAAHADAPGASQFSEPSQSRAGDRGRWSAHGTSTDVCRSLPRCVYRGRPGVIGRGLPVPSQDYYWVGAAIRSSSSSHARRGASRRVLLAQPHHAGNRGSLLWQLTVPSAPRLCFRGDAPIFRACLRGTELARCRVMECSHSNRAAHADAREGSHVFSSSQSRAGGRGRLVP